MYVNIIITNKILISNNIVLVLQRIVVNRNKVATTYDSKFRYSDLKSMYPYFI